MGEWASGRVGCGAVTSIWESSVQGEAALGECHRSGKGSWAGRDVVPGRDGDDGAGGGRTGTGPEKRLPKVEKCQRALQLASRCPVLTAGRRSSEWMTHIASQATQDETGGANRVRVSR